MSSKGNLNEALAGVLSGMDVIQTTYPFDLAHKGHSIDVEVEECKPGKVEEAKVEEVVAKLEKTLPRVKDLNDASFAKSKEPLVKSCKCYTCQNYNCGYLHHLLDVKEMNATILLIIHNLFSYDEVFRVLREPSTDLDSFIHWYLINC